MQLRRLIAALMTALALFGGGATMTACAAAGSGDQGDGTTDTGNEQQVDTGDADRENLPNNSDPSGGAEQGNVNDDADN
ncbi:hypothetical protein DQ238_11805 [Geodermatophilus sp. TF02-6]|uniref:hypothetical protein n=1 Tax=Geodermatophilus sp. TF02-6 TaxID=2250575 RepID=UPI000DE8118C|nr:hypothetical protein [Geodermatophilus sp. TF02-6]RBY78745.1 hypothetical protein DQ238_11805 [Geodermatophilus sp. TF02-6]